MRSMFRRSHARTRAEVARLEEELRHDRIDEVAALDGLFDQYGRNEPESRRMDPVLHKAVRLARDEGRWAEAVPVFRDERTRRPDYNVPHMWLADFLGHEGRTQSAIALAKKAAKQCRRKSELLAQAAEYALFSGEVRESIHLFAQAIATTREAPGPDEVTVQRAFLFMAELFYGFGDVSGGDWARGVQDVTHLDHEFIDRIRGAADKAKGAERDLILRELPEIGRQLKERVTDQG